MSLRPTVSFTFSVDHANVVKYRIYVTLTAGNYVGAKQIDLPTPCPDWYRMQASEVTPWVTNYIKMSCFNTNGDESPLSNEASTLVTGGLLIR